MTYCQEAMPVELMPKPPYSTGVGSTDCSTLLPAKARLAETMKRAPIAAPLWEAEESWLIIDPFRNQFPQGYGDRGPKRPPPAMGSGAQIGPLNPFSFIRTMTVGSGIAPDLLSRR